MGAQSVVLLRREDDDDGGMTVLERVDCGGCSVQPEPATDSFDTGQQNRQRIRVFAPADSPLAGARNLDALEVDGWVVGQPAAVVVALDGSPAVWPDRHTGQPHHVQLTAVYVAG